ncbi:MAG: HRDC domain-containing protein [Promethearchaeota archaeon]
MVTEGEKNENELRQIRLHNTVMRDIQFSQYILSPKFKNEFKRIPNKTCKECGKVYRVTHWCDDQNRQIWINNWEIIIRSNFKPVRQEPLEFDLESVYIPQHQEETPIDLIKIQTKPVDKPENKPVKLAKAQPKKEIIPQQQPTSKPKTKPVSYPSPAIKKPPVRSQYPPKTQTKKLSVQSITQLTEKERVVYSQLRNWRSIQANRERKPPHLLVVDTALMAVVLYRVSSTHELMQISGFSPHTAQKYGTDILRVMIRNGMATGIKTYQQQRKPSIIQKFVSSDDSNTKKILGGFVCCVVVIIIIIVMTAL